MIHVPHAAAAIESGLCKTVLILQGCLVTDGGGALILVAADRARDFPQPVYLLGTGESVMKTYGRPGQSRPEGVLQR